VCLTGAGRKCFWREPVLRRSGAIGMASPTSKHWETTANVIWLPKERWERSLRGEKLAALCLVALTKEMQAIRISRLV